MNIGVRMTSFWYLYKHAPYISPIITIIIDASLVVKISSIQINETSMTEKSVYAKSLNICLESKIPTSNAPCCTKTGNI